MRTHILAACLLVVLAAGCSGGDSPRPATTASDAADAAARTPAAGTTSPATGTRASPRSVAGPASPRPDWLGTRVLPTGPEGFGEVRETPPELRNRRLPPPPSPLPSPTGRSFDASVQQVPDRVLARSTWKPACPVGREELRYVQVDFWGFDAQPHRGELLVHRSAARDLVEVFRRLYEARFPIEQMQVVSPDELDAPPTGDGNNTTAFVCRPVTGGDGWSQHAYGLAVDINPFHNPYVKGELVVPELASAYTDRDWQRPGMIQPGGPVVEAFDDVGWGWGGRWDSLEDYQHFSATGR